MTRQRDAVSREPAGTTGPAGATGPLIGQAELAAHLSVPDPPVLLDVRWRLGGPPGLGSYLAGHLPGASFIDLDTHLSGRPAPSGQAGTGGRHPLPDTAVFVAAMRKAGLRAGQFAVAYDDGDSTIAARLWWMLRYYGHPWVAVLDGGYSAWAEAGRPVSTDVPAPEPGDFSAITVGAMPVLDADGAARVARSGFLLDARAADRYRGDVEPVDRVGGHIPGAISAPTRDNVRPDGTFLSPAELANRFAALGLPTPTDLTGQVRSSGQAATDPADSGQAGSGPVIGAYCGSGVTAAHEILALELVGLPAALYVGSWSGWSADPARAVATGPGPG